MAALKNIDFKANPEASSNNAISVRADVCKCGKTKCDYTAQVTAAVTAVNLDGDYDGDKVYLPAASYAVSGPGATALKLALQAQLEGMVDNISTDIVVTYTDTTTDTLDVTITNSLLEFKTLNAVAFTKSNCEAA